MKRTDPPHSAVLHYADYGAPYEGNFIASLKTLERTLNASGWRMGYILPARAADCPWALAMQEAQGNVCFAPKIGFGKLVSMLRKQLRENDAGILHVHFIRYREKLAALLAAKTCGHAVKTVCHLHNHLHVPRSILGALPHRFYFTAADAFICCSDSVRASLIRDGAQPDKVFLAENAIDFSRLDDSTPLERATLGVSENEPLLLMFGFDYQRKGVDLAVEAVKLLRMDGLSVSLAISLSSRHDEVERAICTQLGVDALPRWVALLPPRNDVASYYHGCNAFLSPSREEGFCYSLIEAVYCQTPVVASAIDAQRDLALQEEAFFTPGSAADLAAHIRALVKQPQQQEELQAAKARVIERYSLSNWADRIKRVYDVLLTP